MDRFSNLQWKLRYGRYMLNRYRDNIKMRDVLIEALEALVVDCERILGVV